MKRNVGTWRVRRRRVRRVWAERASNAALALAAEALPALAEAAESLAPGKRENKRERPSSYPHASLGHVFALLEAKPPPPEHLRRLTEALVEGGRQAHRLGEAIEAAARSYGRKLDELVDQRLAALADANRSLSGTSWQRRQLLDRTIKATEAERERLAGELHDGPVQRLATLGLALDRCLLRLGRGQAAEAAELAARVRADLGEEIACLRRMMTELRPPALDEHGLDSALRDLVGRWSETTGVPARFDLDAHEEITPEAETVAYRVVQEALTNVAKHAKAGLATVAVGAAGDGMEIVVRDNGKGFKALAQGDLARDGHFGVMFMRERAELASGRFELTSAPLLGTVVRLWLPSRDQAPQSETDGLLKLLEVVRSRDEIGPGASSEVPRETVPAYLSSGAAT